MSYQDRIDIDRLYDLIYDARSEQLKVVTREEFEQLFGSISSFKDMQELYYDKSEVYLKILEVLKEAGVITEDTYNELIAKIQTAQNTADLADTKATNAVGTANTAQTSATNALNGVNRIDGEIGDTSTQGTIKYDVNQAKTQSSQAIQDSSVAKQDSSQALTNSNNALEGVDDIRDEIGNATTPNTIKYDVFNAKSNSTEALSKSNQAISDSSDALALADEVDAKADNLRRDVGTVTGSDLQTQVNTVDGKADDLRDDVGTVTGGNLQSQINTVDGKADDLRTDVGTVTGDDLQTQVTTVNGTASNAYTLADEVDAKADDLRTDVGTVNQPTDGSLQQQITYLPAYISDLMVTQSSSTSEMGLPIFCSEFSSSVWYIGFRLTELAKKTIRDYGSITFTIKLNKPNNTTETINHTINNPSQGSIPSIVKIAYPNFLDLWGVTLITCENLKYIIIIGGVATKSHVHTISNITNLQATLNNKSNNGHTHSISDVTNLQTSLDGKANSTHSHSISEVTNLQSSLDSKANSTHSHSISEVTNLQSSLDAKQDSISWETKSVGVGTLEVCSALRLAHWSGGGFYNVTQNYKTMTGVDLSDYAPNKPITNFADSINPLLIIYIQTDGVVKYASQSSTGNFYLSWDILWKY